MPTQPSPPTIPLPRGWPSRVKSAILHVISLAQFTLAYTRGWAANSPNSRIRLKAELDRALHDVFLERIGEDRKRLDGSTPQLVSIFIPE